MYFLVGNFPAAFNEADDVFEKKWGCKKPAKDSQVVVYCRVRPLPFSPLILALVLISLTSSSSSPVWCSS